MNKVILSSLITMQLFSSCAIQKRLPITRFETPEIHFEEGGKNAVLLASTKVDREITISEDTTATQPILNHPKNESFRTLGGAGKIAASHQIEFGFEIGLLEMPRLSAKYQFMGSTKKTAEKGNFSGAVLIGGWFQDEKDGKDEGIFPQVDARYSTEFLSFELMGILGYRITDQVLVYGGPSFNLFRYSGNLRQTNTSGTEIYNKDFKGIYHIPSFNLGFEFSPNREDRSFFIRTDAALNQFSENRSSICYVTGGLSIGFLL